MPVPEAPMDEDDLLETREREVGTSNEISPVQSVPVSHGVYKAPHDHFGLGIFIANAAHAFAPLCAG